MRLSGKTIVITGAASGIGAACADACASEGAHVTGIDLAPSPAAARSILADVADEAAIEAAFAGIPRVDALINSAGIARRFPVAEMDAAGWDEVMRVNVRGSFLASKHAIPRMREHGGAILHMASVVGITGVRNRSAYSTSKAAIIGLTRNMAVDYAQYKIRVNCLCPGFTRTPLTKALFDDPARLAKLTALHPLGRLGEPEDIARAAVFLVSDDSSWITGQAIAVDGGFSAGHGADV